MKKLFAAWAAVLCLAFAPSAIAQDVAEENPFAALPWEWGPTTGRIGTTATIDVPEGYVFLGPAGAREFNRLNENPNPGVDEYVFAKDDLSWVAFFSFDPVGYVADDETLDAPALLESVTDGTEASNEERLANGWSALHVTGWAFEPKYDAQIRSLEWAFRLRSEDGESINYNTRLLGRRGVMSVLLVTPPDTLDVAVADFKARLPGYAFAPGETYAEFREGDNVAAYGLAALVAGGATAIASKKGLFAAIGVFLLKFWKLVLVGLAGVVALLRSLYKKKSEAAG